LVCNIQQILHFVSSAGTTWTSLSRNLRIPSGICLVLLPSRAP